MRKILTDEQIGDNLRSVIEAMDLTQDDFADKIGKNKTHISGYVGNTGGRKAKNLLPDLISLGINGNWFLTGEGSMFISGSNSVLSDEDKATLEIGREFIALVQKAQKFSEPVSKGDEDGMPLPAALDPNRFQSRPGPAPNLTDEEYEELVRLREGGGHVSRRDE
jgi:hypothetical protein